MERTENVEDTALDRAIRERQAQGLPDGITDEVGVIIVSRLLASAEGARKASQESGSVSA